MPVDRGWSFRLTRDEELAAGLARAAVGLAEAALERLRESEAGEGDAAAAVHGVRKDMKKLRTVLRLLRFELGGKRYRRENGRFRDAARALSEARDAEVKLKTLEALAEHEEDLPAETLDAWRKILDRDREAAANLVAHDEATIAEARSLIEPGLESIHAWELEGDSWKLVEPAVIRTYRRGRRAMKKAEARRRDDDLHKWRKRAKDLWYELRLLSCAWPAPLEATAEETHRLTDLLGDHHDLAVLREDLRQRNLGEAETALAAAIDRRQEELAAEAFSLGRRLYAERPQELNRRLRRYWRGWRDEGLVRD